MARQRCGTLSLLNYLMGIAEPSRAPSMNMPTGIKNFRCHHNLIVLEISATLLLSLRHCLVICMLRLSI
jgi:hypothetical protein